MKSSYFMRGSGGQGIQVVGMMLLRAMDELGGHASFFPEYGASKRGGFSQCAVMISDEPIRSFTSKAFHTVVTLNRDSYEKYGSAVTKGGLLVANSSLIHDINDSDEFKTVCVPFDELARSLGNQKVMNTLLFGFLVGYQRLMDREVAEKIVIDTTASKPTFRDLNLKALELGFSEAAKCQ